MQVKSLAPVAPAAATPLRPAHVLRGTSLLRALDVLGDWWTQRILREAFLGVRTFDAFQRHLEIPRQTLSGRLKSLVEHAILDSATGSYRLTPRGLGLYPWALMIWRWSSRWAGAAGPRHPSRLVHASCCRAMRPVFACTACRREVTLGDVDYEGRPSLRHGAPIARNDRRWTGGTFAMSAKDAGHNVAFLTADRWTHLILSAAFLGCRTFDALQLEIGISSNILAQRLALLVEVGFLLKTRSPKDARRFIYRLTPRSRDVFPITIALVQWADRWLVSSRPPPMTRIHRSCGRPLRASAACSACGEELLPRRVRFEPLPQDPVRA